jgi:hypothetical protein
MIRSLSKLGAWENPAIIAPLGNDEAICDYVIREGEDVAAGHRTHRRG